MDIEKLFNDKKEVEKQFSFYQRKNHLIKIKKDKDLVNAHIEKAKHNMLFFDKNKDSDEFNDWLIVTLYYALYHSVLALIVNKEYNSKNHSASLIFLIKYYSQFKEDIILLQELSIKKEDAELYTNLKEDRHKASYETKHNFQTDNIIEYRSKVIDFIHKAEDIIQNTINT
tara:strand:- start:945 stop:1457 length:513 start_codon:yes stop_codon:yes gene_type:complete